MAEKDADIRITWDDIQEGQHETSGATGRSAEGESTIRVADRAQDSSSDRRSYGRIARSRPGGKRVSSSRRFLLAAPFYMCVAGICGALVGWGVTEAVLSDRLHTNYLEMLGEMALWFGVIGASVGALIGAAEGVASRAWNKAISGGAAGLGIGLIGCAVGGIVAQITYTLLLASGDTLTLSRQMTARTIGWGVAGMFLGLGPGVATLSGKKLLNGLLGGLGGGLVGGLLFDPVGMLTGAIRGGMVSRLIGLLIIGGTTGTLIGLVENLLKDAWLYVTKGPLAGKQFVIYKDPTIIGSSPKAEVYLFKDDAIEPQHAAVHTLDSRYEIEDLATEAGTYINGRRVQRQRLRDGDLVRIGKTVFEYSEKTREA
ncbi:MAG: FHA domain-containing protein [Candidatus Brocadiia bacterium]